MQSGSQVQMLQILGEQQRSLDAESVSQAAVNAEEMIKERSAREVRDLVREGIKVSSSWTPSNSFLAVGVGASADLQVSKDLEIIGKPLRLLHITDSHISVGNIPSSLAPLVARMHKVNDDTDLRTDQASTHFDQFASAMRLAKESKVDLILVGGDLVNFPLPETVSSVLELLVTVPTTSDNKRIPYVYTAGNHDWMIEGLQSDSSCRFVREDSKYLSEFANGDQRVYSRSEAEDTCTQMMQKCAGITCDGGIARCTVRKGREFHDSPEGEVSFLKSCTSESYDFQRDSNRLNVLSPFYAISGVLGSFPRQYLEPHGVTVQPGFSAVQMRGVNVVAVDNSNYAFDKAQHSFLQEQVALGIPIVLLLHIPLYVVGGPGQDVTNTPRVGDPRWGEALDKWWELESRPPWPKKSSTETHIAVDFILANCAPHGPILTVLAGHEHITHASPIGPWSSAESAPLINGSPRWGQHGGAVQFNTLDGGRGGYRIVEVALHRSFSGHCYAHTAGGWTYKICFGSYVRQVRGSEGDQGFLLGVHDPQMDQTLPDGARVSAYVNGTDGRLSSVVSRCSRSGARVTVSEPSPMRYAIEAWLPSLCQDKPGRIDGAPAGSAAQPSPAKRAQLQQQLGSAREEDLAPNLARRLANAEMELAMLRAVDAPTRSHTGSELMMPVVATMLVAAAWCAYSARHHLFRGFLRKGLKPGKRKASQIRSLV